MSLERVPAEGRSSELHLQPLGKCILETVEIISGMAALGLALDRIRRVRHHGPREGPRDTGDGGGGAGVKGDTLGSGM